MGDGDPAALTVITPPGSHGGLLVTLLEGAGVRVSRWVEIPDRAGDPGVPVVLVAHPDPLAQAMAATRDEAASPLHEAVEILRHREAILLAADLHGKRFRAPRHVSTPLLLADPVGATARLLRRCGLGGAAERVPEPGAVPSWPDLSARRGRLDAALPQLGTLGFPTPSSLRHRTPHAPGPRVSQLWVAAAGVPPEGWTPWTPPDPTGPDRLAPPPFQAGSAEAAVVVDLVTCLPQAAALTLLRKVRRVLRPGGRLRLLGERPPWAGDDDHLDMLLWHCGLDRVPPALDVPGAGWVELARVRHDDGPTPMVSVLIPGYRPEFLRQALASALRQTWPNLEVVVADDSPGGAGAAVVAEVAKGDPRVRYLRNDPPKGARGNYKQLVGLARGAYIKFLWDDDLLDPDCLRRLATVLRDRPDVALVTSNRRVIDAEGTPIVAGGGAFRVQQRDVVIDGARAVDLMARFSTNWIGEPSIAMFRRADVPPGPVFDTRLAGRFLLIQNETVVWPKLLGRGDLAYLAERLSSFRLHPGQLIQDPEVRDRVVRAWDQIRTACGELGLYNPDVEPGLNGEPLYPPPWWGPPARRKAANVDAAVAAGDGPRTIQALLALHQQRAANPWIATRLADALRVAGQARQAARVAQAVLRVHKDYMPAQAMAGAAVHALSKPNDAIFIWDAGCAPTIPYLYAGGGERPPTQAPNTVAGPWWLWLGSDGLPLRIRMRVTGDGVVRLVHNGVAMAPLDLSGGPVTVDLLADPSRPEQTVCLGTPGDEFVVDGLVFDLHPLHGVPASS